HAGAETRRRRPPCASHDPRVRPHRAADPKHRGGVSSPPHATYPHAATRRHIARQGDTVGSLPTTPLGITGMDITRVGFGAWAIGGDWLYGWGQQSDDESVAAIRHAVESGVNWIDTAAVYGLGHSEEVVARAL